MANEQKIDEIIDQSAFDQIAKLIKDMELLNKTLADSARLVLAINSNIAGAKSFGDFNKQSTNLAIAMEKINVLVAKQKLLEQKLADTRAKGAADFEKKVQREIAAQEKKAAKSVQLSEKERLAEIKLENARRKSFDDYEKGIKKKEAADKKNAEQIQKNSRAYTILSNTLEDQRKKAQDLAIIYGETSPQFLNAAKGVIELDNRLKAIDKTLGKSQRYVGEYERANYGLSNSINQITRELPALAINANTFFLAISNNLPIFFDAIKQANDVIKESRAAAVADAEAKGLSAAATAAAGGASEEAAAQVGEFAKEQALAAAETIKGPGILKQLATSLFSVQTALSLGVTLLTLYGGEIVSFIGELFKGKEAIDKAKLSMEALNKAIQGTEFSKAIKDLSELRINVQLAKEGLLDKTKVLKQYNKTIGKTTGEVSSLDQAEKAMVKNGNAYIKITLLKAAAQIALEDAAKNSYEAELARNKSAEDTANGLDKFLGAFTAKGGNPYLEATHQEAAYNKEVKKSGQKRKDQLIKDAEDSAKVQLSIAEKFQKDAAKIAKKFGFDFFSGDFEDTKKKTTNTDEQDRIIQLVQFEMDAQKQIAENEQETFDKRIDAARNFNTLSLRMAELTAKRDLMEADITAARKLAIKDKQNNDLIVADKEFTDLTDKIFNDQLTKEEKERAIAYQKELNQINEQEAYKLDLLEQAYVNRTISEKQYNELTVKLQREAFQKYINKEIEQAEELLKLSTLTAEQRAAAEKNLAELKAKYSRESRKNLIEDNKQILKNEQEVANERKHLSEDLKNTKVAFEKEIKDFTVALVAASFDNQKKQYQEESDAIDVRSAAQIENVNNSVATEEEKANKIAIIEAKAAAQKELLANKQQEIDRKKQRFEKLAAIAGVAIDTASAVFKIQAIAAVLAANPLTALLAPFALAQIPYVIGAGILSAATIAVKSAYKDGTSSSKEGLALTDEAGPELYVPRSGKPYIGSDKPNIKYLQAGTKVIPHHQLVQMMAKPTPLVDAGGTSFDLMPMVNEQRNSTKRLERALEKVKSANNSPTKRGWYNTHEGINHYSKYFKNNL